MAKRNQYRLMIGCFFFVLATICLFSPLVKAEPTGEPWALLVGCSDYEFLPGRNLRGPKNDVRQFAETLKTRFGFAPDHVRTLVGKPDDVKLRPTRENILRELDELAKVATKETQIVIAFSGPGTRVPLPEGQDPFDPKNPEPDGAVAKYYLHQKKNLTDGVKEAYKAALDAFKKEIDNELALKALCYTDYDQYLSLVTRDYPEAANQYQLALTLFGSDLIPLAQAKDMMGQPIMPPASQTAASVIASGDEQNGSHRIVSGSAPTAFRVFALCCEAEAWQRQNRWGKANDLLNTARYFAQDFDSEHELMVFVLNRVAWANMEQWRIAEAQQYFRQANEILVRMSRTTSDLATVKTTADHNQIADQDKANCKLIMGTTTTR